VAGRVGWQGRVRAWRAVRRRSQALAQGLLNVSLTAGCGRKKSSKNNNLRISPDRKTMSSLALSNLRQNILGIKVGELGIPLLVMVIMAMLVIPLPAFLLDVLFTFNLITGLMVIMVAIRTTKPLEFSSFPSVLLLTTMLRLA